MGGQGSGRPKGIRERSRPLVQNDLEYFVTFTFRHDASRASWAFSPTETFKIDKIEAPNRKKLLEVVKGLMGSEYANYEYRDINYHSVLTTSLWESKDD